MTRYQVQDDLEERLQAMDSCEFVSRNGIRVLSVEEDEVRVGMEVEGKRNAFGTAHGGAIFSLADQAFAIAANKDGTPQVAISANINFLNPASGSLEAVARKVEENRRTSVYQVIVYQGDKVVAIFQGVGYKLRERD
ncbi:MAG: PaaI family thioesterase [Methanomassiliicoccales archaeon]